MGLLDYFEKLDKKEIVGRWGHGSVAEAYELISRPFRLQLLYSTRQKNWMAYWGYHQEKDVRDVPSKESGVAFFLKSLQRHKIRLERELNYANELEGLLGERDRKSALERLVDGPI